MASSSVDAIGRRKHKLSSKDQDLISNLPDHIIGCILSFLPTKDAVSTSVLSKRWIYHWKFITRLNFDDMDHFSNKIRKKGFVDFVDRVLLHLNSAHIQSFSLKMSEYDSSYLNKWISVVINLRVRNLCVYLKKELDIQLVSFDTLFKCQSLEELVLNGCAFTLPSFVCLSSLTILKLSSINIFCDSSNESKTLALNFPALRKYETVDCTFPGVKSVTLQVPLLEVVSISYTPFYHTSHAEIKFYASRLAKFGYSGDMSDTILFEARSVASADIILYNNKEKSAQEIGIFICKLLGINPESLKLQMFGRTLQEKLVSFDALFKYQSLEELVLNGCAFTLPSFVCLSSLTILKLSSINIFCDSSNESKTLALNFPALRKYETLDCTFSRVKNVTLQVPLLEVVSISYTPFYHTSHAKIKFYASRLAKFGYSGDMSDTILLEACSVASADIILYNNEKNSAQEIGIFVCKLLGIIPESLKLKMLGRTLQSVMFAGIDDSLEDIPPFVMLRHLELNSVGCKNLLAILLKSPCLETLILQELCIDGMELSSAIVPHCLLFTLKVLKFEIFCHYKHLLFMAKFFIENGQVLERISFRLGYLKIDKEKILSIKKRSSSAIIEFLP